MPFPTTPSNGDTYENENGTIYIYESGDNKWSIWSPPFALTPLEFEMQFNTNYRSYTTSGYWSGGLITKKEYYVSDAKSTLLYTMDYTWVTGDLDYKTLTDEQTATGMKIDYTWISGLLIQTDRTWV